MKRSITAIAVAVLMTGCTRTPNLVPRLLSQGENVGDAFWLAAPYVLVAKITKADLVGPRQPLYRGGPKYLQLVKFTADVENVLKGELQDKTIEFFFFANLGGKATYHLDPGKRYIVSLRREGTVLRSWADGTQLKIELHSGRHNQSDLPLPPPLQEPPPTVPERLPPDRGVEATITYLLLTPGQDCDLNEFASMLPLNPHRYGRPGYVNQLLTRLLQHPDQQVREAACFELKEAFGFDYRPKCLEQCLNSPDGRTRQTAERMLKEQDIVTLPLLRGNPSALFPLPEPTIDSIIETFGIYAEDIRPEVRQAACAALKSFAPQRAGEYCGASKQGVSATR